MTAPEAWPCPRPAFAWTGQSWSLCSRCGRGAWDHEQSDPLEDIRIAIQTRFKQGWKYPPAMRKAADSVEKDDAES